MSEFAKHGFSYGQDGARWSTSVMATSEADARRRLSNAAMGTFDWIVMTEIPAVPGIGLGLRLLCLVRNLLRDS